MQIDLVEPHNSMIRSLSLCTNAKLKTSFLTNAGGCQVDYLRSTSHQLNLLELEEDRFMTSSPAETEIQLIRSLKTLH
jgi:hypothetical protein